MTSSKNVLGLSRMITEPLFWICAVIAVLLTGVSKGGLGGVGLLAVPLLAITISPVRAAGIMLPILILMDAVSAYAYRNHFDLATLKLMIPGALIGIVIGGLIAGFVSENLILICVGVIALTFSLYSVFKPKNKVSFIKDNKRFGVIVSIVAGFTSFVAHAGGPPFKIYAIPQDLEKRILAGTAVMFFSVLNAVKLVPYFMLGQFDRSNLMTSLYLAPLAPLGVLLGVWLVKILPQEVFYKFLYSMVFIVGVKLLYDGLLG